ncbi:MAG: hypothetical protein WED05_07330 [Candidatus Atabeyarchaeum deiterrae]|jgi:hypothetical protein
MRIVEVSSQLPARVVDLLKKAYHLVPVDKCLLVCPNSTWDRMKDMAKQLVTDVTMQKEYHLQERSMILVKETVKDAKIMDQDKVKVKFNHSELVGKLLMSGGECPFCGQNKLTFLSFENEKTTVCLNCKRNIVIINSDSIPEFNKLFPEIYKVV